MIRSYTKTRNLEELAQRDPEIAEQVEALCRAVLALRGFALIMQADSVLSYAARATEPFVNQVDAKQEARRIEGEARLAKARGRS